MKKEEIENQIEKLKLELAGEEIKLQFINEVGEIPFDENKFKVYKTLQIIKSDLSDVDKLKIIADLIKPNLTEPITYSNELVDLWHQLTKNTVIQNRNGSTYFYDTAKKRIIMENEKTWLWCRYLEFWNEFERIVTLQNTDTNIQEFIKTMVFDTYQIRVNPPIRIYDYTNWDIINTLRKDVVSGIWFWVVSV